MGWGWFAAGLLLLLAPAPAGQPDAAGRYRLTGEQDVASELLLLPNGRFAYGLAAGALDETAQGRWRREGDSVFLTTDPKPVPPVVTLDRVERSEATALAIRVETPGGEGLANVDLRIGFAEGGNIEAYTQEDGWSLPADEWRTPAWIELSVPMHDFASPRFPVDAAPANFLIFVLTPNDLGIVDFEELRLDVGPGRLLMHRGGATLSYERTGGLSP